MIQNIIGDVICLQRLQIIGKDRLEADLGGDFTKCSWRFVLHFQKSAEERNVCPRKLNGPEVIEIRGLCVWNREGDNFQRGIWYSPRALEL